MKGARMIPETHRTAPSRRQVLAATLSLPVRRLGLKPE